MVVYMEVGPENTIPEIDVKLATLGEPDFETRE